MTVFGTYSKYYNLLYKDKDCKSEVEYVDGLIRKYAPGATTILNLGCGTGRHDFLLTEKGYAVTGVDMSKDMLAVANSNLSTFNPQLSAPQFIHGDIRTVRLGKAFDTIISLFHVMSYQTTNEDLAAAFATARTHLNPGGVFIFDCWYGPAVLTDRPAVRIKRLENEVLEVTRLAEPVMYPNANLVDVKYQVFIRDKADNRVDELKESHLMRYLFGPEIEKLAGVEGLKLIRSEEWMTGRRPGFDTWGVCFVCEVNG